MSPARWYHGGPRIDGHRVEPGALLGAGSRSGPVPDDRVYITPERGLAAMYASSVEGPAWVYEVEPDEEPQPDETTGLTDLSFTCSGARILRRWTISNAEREHRRRTLTRVMSVLEARS